MSPPDRLDGLRVVGIDELSYRRHHKYVTIVTDHETGKIVWAKEGKNAATLDAFFAQLGADRCAQLQTVTLVSPLWTPPTGAPHARGSSAGLSWASRSRLAPFVRVGRTIRKHLDGILAYLNSGLSNGRAEGLNGKARVITRRSYGLHSAKSLIALLFLCCSLPRLLPVRVPPNSRPLTC